MVTDAERAEHAARLRGLLYLACPDAPATAITATAEAIAENAEEKPQGPVLQAAQLSQTRPPLDELNLRGADLRGAGLANADLNGADLTGADLANANLTGAHLTGAHLNGANLTGANLTGAHLTGANLTGADLTGAHLRSAHLNGAILYRAILKEADLTGADLTGANLTGAKLPGANLTGAKLPGANLRGARLTSVVNMHLPVGATWDSFTRWPANLASVVIKQSDEVSPGVYQVRRGGQSPDRSAVRA
ncbi:pentapeptide repeat-containing protein [Streptomyces sp. NPDC005065]|uniref:pentapeptide repeat-containing protein n=1 Tax=unclassified Streptomyces TaxID=2593676 RepID=UPI0033B269DD